MATNIAEVVNLRFISGSKIYVEEHSTLSV